MIHVPESEDETPDGKGSPPSHSPIAAPAHHPRSSRSVRESQGTGWTPASQCMLRPAHERGCRKRPSCEDTPRSSQRRQSVLDIQRLRAQSLQGVPPGCSQDHDLAVEATPCGDFPICPPAAEEEIPPSRGFQRPRQLAVGWDEAGESKVARLLKQLGAPKASAKQGPQSPPGPRIRDTSMDHTSASSSKQPESHLVDAEAAQQEPQELWAVEGDMTCASMTVDMSREIWKGWDSWTIRWPRQVPNATALRPQRSGCYPWDRQKRAPMSHAWRDAGNERVWHLPMGNLRKLTQFVFHTFAPTGPKLPDVDAEEAVGGLLEFLAARPGMAETIVSIRRACPPGVDNSWEYGRWLCLQLGGPRGRQAAQNHQTGFHGTSLYVLNRCVAHGPENGLARFSEMPQCRRTHGVWVYPAKGVCFCRPYLLYSPLERNGFYFAPLLEIAYTPKFEGFVRPGRYRPAIQPAMAHEGSSFLRRIWIHIVHISDVLSGDQAEIINLEAQFVPDWELDPDDNWDAIVNRSRPSARGKGG